MSNSPAVMDAERFLSNTISILATSADLSTTIQNLAGLASTELADCCVVFTFENERTVRRLAIANRTQSISNGHQTNALYPLDLHAPTGPGHLLRTGECETLTVTPAVLESLGLSDESFLSGDLRASTYLGMPIVARGRTIGAIAFLSAAPEKQFDDDDLTLMRGVANAAGAAIDNAKLYMEAQKPTGSRMNSSPWSRTNCAPRSRRFLAAFICVEQVH